MLDFFAQKKMPAQVSLFVGVAVFSPPQHSLKTPFA
jgi:hypothetical protein